MTNAEYSEDLQEHITIDQRDQELAKLAPIEWRADDYNNSVALGSEQIAGEGMAPKYAWQVSPQFEAYIDLILAELPKEFRGTIGRHMAYSYQVGQISMLAEVMIESEAIK